MTNDKILAAAEVMRRAANGEIVESRIINGNFGPTEWKSHGDSGSPSWNWDACEFRIKPKPREVYIAIGDIPASGGGHSASYVIDAAGFEPASTSCARMYRKFREVIE